jgi:hypothetical protein
MALEQITTDMDIQVPKKKKLESMKKSKSSNIKLEHAAPQDKFDEPKIKHEPNLQSRLDILPSEPTEKPRQIETLSKEDVLSQEENNANMRKNDARLKEAMDEKQAAYLKMKKSKLESLKKSIPKS